MTLREAERAAGAAYLREVLAGSKNVTEAARRAGVKRSSFYEACEARGVEICFDVPYGNQYSRRTWLPWAAQPRAGL